MDEPRFESRADFAKRVGVSRAAVTQWAAAGRLVLAEDGRVNVAASEARLAATVNSRGGKRQAGMAGGAHAIEAAPELDFTGGTLTDAKIRQAIGKTKLDDLEYRERIGSLIERARIEAAIADGLSPIMSQFDTLSTRVGPKLVGLTELRTIQDLIDDEVAVLRQEAADTLRAMLPGATRQ